jgi:alginate O-acetyltransferase complex protein AlgI
MRQILTFHIVCLSWIFFRATSVSAAVQMLGTLGNFHWEKEFGAAWLFLGLLGGLGLLMDLQMEFTGDEYVFQSRPGVVAYGTAVTAMFLLTLFSASGSHAFIYFQF